MISPLARQTGLLTEWIGTQLVVHDQERQRLHTLNQTVAVVWRCCNGRHTIAELTALVSRDLTFPMDESVILLALEDLQEAELLVEDGVTLAALAGSTRRTLLRRAAAFTAGVLLPSIRSLGSPTPAAA